MRQKPVVRRRQANDDIDAAVSYLLAEAGVRVGTDFLNQLESAIKIISSQPGAGSQRFGHELDIADLRHRPMRQFPYLIFYLEKERHIEIVRVLHTKRDISSSIPQDDTE